MTAIESYLVRRMICDLGTKNDARKALLLEGERFRKKRIDSTRDDQCDLSHRALHHDCAAESNIQMRALSSRYSSKRIRGSERRDSRFGTGAVARLLQSGRR